MKKQSAKTAPVVTPRKHPAVTGLTIGNVWATLSDVILVQGMNSERVPSEVRANIPLLMADGVPVTGLHYDAKARAMYVCDLPECPQVRLEPWAAHRKMVTADEIAKQKPTPGGKPRELATILAALRLYQHVQGSDGLPTVPGYSKQFSNLFFEDCKPLNATQIDALCERLNFAGG